MLNDDDTPLEFMDLLLDRAHPVAWTINNYPRPTGRHFDIHAGLEIGVVLAGKSRRLYRDHQTQTRAGDLWLIAPWEPHGVQILAKNTAHLVLGIFPEFLCIPDRCAGCDWMQLFRLPPSLRPKPTSAGQRQYNLASAAEIISILQSSDPYRLARLRLVLQHLLLGLMEQSQPLTDRVAEPSPAEGSNILAALRLVERDPGRKITLAIAARAAKMSRTRFAEQFLSFTGLTFARYLARRRLRGVVGELQGDDQKLLAIARRWGFADASHLVRVFRQHMGCTPQAYRRSNRGSANAAIPQRLGAMPLPRVFFP